MARKLFEDMKVPEGDKTEKKEYTPPKEEFDLAEVIKPVEYYESRFQQLLDNGNSSLDDEVVAEYREEFGQLVDILNGMSGEDRDFSYELDDLLTRHKSYLEAKCVTDDEFDDENLMALVKNMKTAFSLVEDMLYDDTKSFFADLRFYYATAITEYYLKKNKKDLV